MRQLLSIPYGPVLLLISFGLAFLIWVLVRLKQLFIWVNSWIENFTLSNKIRSNNKKCVDDEKAYKNGAPHVLYLRAFASDGTTHSEKQIVINDKAINLYKFKDLEIKAPANVISVDYNLEVKLADTAHRIGPFIGIGDVHASTLNLGACRLHFSDEIWKQSASLLMEQAAMIIVKISGILGAGFIWEIKELQSKFSNKTIYCIDIQEEKVYKTFVTVLGQLNLNFPSRFDIYKNLGIYFSFNEKGDYNVCPHLELHDTFLSCLNEANKRKKNINN